MKVTNVWYKKEYTKQPNFFKIFLADLPVSVIICNKLRTRGVAKKLSNLKGGEGVPQFRSRCSDISPQIKLYILY